jgi:hypothetical protein
MKIKTKGQNFQVAFFHKEKMIKLPRETIFYREKRTKLLFLLGRRGLFCLEKKGTKFPRGKRDYASVLLGNKFLNV